MDSTRKLHIYSSGKVNANALANRYTDNGGSTLGISGKDFTVLAGDTRSTSGYNINTRYAPKLFRIGGDGPNNEGAKSTLR